MKYLVIKDCPGFKVGDVVEPIPTNVGKEDLILGNGELNQPMPIYIANYYPEYFKPMWFNFGDKIRQKKRWGKNEYFIPTQCNYHHCLGYTFVGYYYYYFSKEIYTHFFECLNQDYWEFYE